MERAKAAHRMKGNRVMGRDAAQTFAAQDKDCSKMALARLATPTLGSQRMERAVVLMHVDPAKN